MSQSKFEIHSSSGNYYLNPGECSIDTSDIGPNSAPEEFVGALLPDVVVDELQNKGWSVPGIHQVDSTENLDFSRAKRVKADGGYFYIYDSAEGEPIQMYHSANPLVVPSDTIFDGIGGRDLKNHVLTSWAQYNERFIYFCDKVFKDPVDLKVVLQALKSDATTHCTKDSCVGYALRNQGSVSIRYKKPWREISREYLKTVEF